MDNLVYEVIKNQVSYPCVWHVYKNRLNPFFPCINPNP